jgi:hypothetical protein
VYALAGAAAGSQQFTGFNDRHRYLTVKLNCLSGLLREIVNNHGLDRHLNDVRGMGSIQLGT